MPTPAGFVAGQTLPAANLNAALGVKFVRCASTANVTIATALEAGDSIDGVTLAAGDRVLLKNQSTGAENGLYVAVASGAGTRATDFDHDTEAVSGVCVVVQEGTSNKDSIWQLTTNETIDLDTTALVFFPVHLQGTGSPEGAVTAPIGAIYRRTDGGAGTSVYAKESGTGNTGWVALSTASGAVSVGDLSDVEYARKTADESVTSSTTLQDDDHLVKALDANATYLIIGSLGLAGAAAGDFQGLIAGPAGSTVRTSFLGPSAGTADVSATTMAANSTGGSASGVGVDGTNDSVVVITGLIRTAGTAGDGKLRWAQAASSGTATTLRTDSWLAFLKVA